MIELTAWYPTSNDEKKEVGGGIVTMLPFDSNFLKLRRDENSISLQQLNAPFLHLALTVGSLKYRR